MGVGDPEEQLVSHSQVAFARSLGYNFWLHVGSQEDPETCGQILPESQRRSLKTARSFGQYETADTMSRSIQGF